jgi:hypothetical protein
VIVSKQRNVNKTSCTSSTISVQTVFLKSASSRIASIEMEQHEAIAFNECEWLYRLSNEGKYKLTEGSPEQEARKWWVIELKQTQSLWSTAAKNTQYHGQVRTMRTVDTN